MPAPTTLHSLTVVRLLVLPVMLLGCVPSAEGQIYTWRDASGTLVMSDRAPAAGTESRTFSVPGTESIRVTRSVVNGTGRQRYDNLIEDAANTARIRPDLVRAVIQVESGFDPRARSPKGAMGLMQLMPGTAADLGVQNPYNPEQNIRGGVTYLRQLLDKYGNNEELALAAYNAGPEAVDRYGYQIPPYRETREYVNKVKDRTDVASSPSRAPRFIYRLFEMIDGRKVVTGYQDHPPAAGLFDELKVR